MKRDHLHVNGYFNNLYNELYNKIEKIKIENTVN
jgi:hypothetical protein